MLLPPLLMNGLRSVLPVLRSSKAAVVVAETGLIAGSVYFALPGAIAIFPQEMKIDAAKLEPELQPKLVDKQGNRIEYVVCNKGL